MGERTPSGSSLYRLTPVARGREQSPLKRPMAVCLHTGRSTVERASENPVAQAASAHGEALEHTASRGRFGASRPAAAG